MSWESLPHPPATPARDRGVDASANKQPGPRRKFVQWVGWTKKQCSSEVGSGAELDPDDLVSQQICITLSNSNIILVATVEAHCSGTTYSINSSDLGEMDDCTVDMLLPKRVKWKCWRLANCTEYGEDDVSGVSGEGGAGGESGSGSNEEDHCHDGETQELAEDASWSE